MATLNVTLANMVLTIWIAGGFLLLLLLTREKPAEDASESVQSRDNPPAPVRRVSPRRKQPQAVRDVYWVRQRGEAAIRSRKAA